jgi:hypothetical protein
LIRLEKYISKQDVDGNVKKRRKKTREVITKGKVELLPETVISLKKILTDSYLNQASDEIISKIFPGEVKSIGDLTPNKQKEFSTKYKTSELRKNMDFGYQYADFIDFTNGRIKQFYQIYFVPSFLDFCVKNSITTSEIDENTQGDLFENYSQQFMVITTGLLSRAIPTGGLYDNSVEDGKFTYGKYGLFLTGNPELTKVAIQNQMTGPSEKIKGRLDAQSTDEKVNRSIYLKSLLDQNRDEINEKMSLSQLQRWNNMGEHKEFLSNRYSKSRKRYIEKLIKIIAEEGMASYSDLDDDDKVYIVGVTNSTAYNKIMSDLRKTSETLDSTMEQILEKITLEQSTFFRSRERDITDENRGFAANNVPPLNNLIELVVINKDKKMQFTSELQNNSEYDISKVETPLQKSFYAGMIVEKLYWTNIIPRLMEENKDIVASIQSSWCSESDFKGGDFIFIQKVKSGSDLSEEEAQTLERYLEIMKNPRGILLISDICLELMDDKQLDSKAILCLSEESIFISSEISDAKVNKNTEYDTKYLLDLVSKFSQSFKIKSIDVKINQKTIDSKKIVFSNTICPTYDQDGIIDFQKTVDLLKTTLQNEISVK